MTDVTIRRELLERLLDEGRRSDTWAAQDELRAILAAPVQGLRIVFDGPPAPEGGRFVEVENAAGQSVNAGEWRERTDGLWELVLYTTPPQPAEVGELVAALKHARMFIVNGVDLGYIRMPDADTPDQAHDTLPIIDAALAKLEQNKP